MATETSDDTACAYCYPPKEVYENWKQGADEMDMTVSEYIQAMVSAGRKQFNRDVSPDETNLELREQRNHYKQQVKEERERTQQLEERLSTGERSEIIEFVNDNPGTTYKEIVNHIGETVGDRVTDLLELLEGSEVVVEDGNYYPTGGDE